MIRTTRDERLQQHVLLLKDRQQLLQLGVEVNNVKRLTSCLRTAYYMLTLSTGSCPFTITSRKDAKRKSVDLRMGVPKIYLRIPASACRFFLLRIERVLAACHKFHPFRPVRRWLVFWVAGELGFEPRQTESESRIDY
jgi:hypothetical protein